jgi:hypothetical protein
MAWFAWIKQQGRQKARVQNGIRFTGMPAFGKVEPPDHIRDVVNYVRTLPGASQPQNSKR